MRNIATCSDRQSSSMSLYIIILTVTSPVLPIAESDTT